MKEQIVFSYITDGDSPEESSESDTDEYLSSHSSVSMSTSEKDTGTDESIFDNNDQPKEEEKEEDSVIKEEEGDSVIKEEEEDSVIKEEEESVIKEEEEDSVITAIMKARDKPFEKPPDIFADDYFVDISFHPSADILLGGSVTGDAVVYKYSVENTELVATYELHTKACRAIEFSESGDMFFTAAADKSIMVTDTDSGKLKQFYDEAHEDPLYSLAVINEHLIATGDENGVVRMWDLRQKSHIFSSKKMDDYVSKILTNDEARYLVCTSGEGSVTSFDIAAKCVHIQSELYEADFTCAGLFKKESKLAVGTTRGSLVFYKWGEFGLHADDLPWCKNKAINCLIPVSENIAVTGWEDGQIRASYLFPHRQLGVVGHHKLSVEALDISHDGSFIASSSADQTVKFWPISFLEDPENLALDKNIPHNLPSSNVIDRATFFSELS